ncbi:hypothetical protein ACNF42_00200 [Cuniculiplasma sp. SKW3]|uniref:hypothetical protein n=1 Tax=Cuniculiplasma sp. SKW3 TaxID=3400170 RepID=UPI003FD32F2E
MTIKSFNFSKVGNRQEESEDSFALNSQKGRYAICDGASDSIFSGLWAKCLADSFVSEPYNLDSEEEYFLMLTDARKKWFSSINWARLPWNVKNKSIRGSYCTFLGVSIVSDDAIYCDAWAVGDSCLFIFEDNNFSSFPLTKPEDFGVHPDLVWSGYGHPMNERKEYRPDYKVKKLSIEIPEGSKIVIATDALSKYLMEGGEESLNNVLQNMHSRDFFDERRSDGSIKNDDLSAVIISFS